MNNETDVSHLYGLLHSDVERFNALAELAMGMRLSLNHATDQVWWQLDPEFWELTKNPWAVRPADRVTEETAACSGRPRLSQNR